MYNTFAQPGTYEFDKIASHYEVRQKHGLPGGVCDMTFFEYYGRYYCANGVGEMTFIKEGIFINVIFVGEEVIGISPPLFVELEVTQSEPGIKGNTATGTTKPATLETGFSVNVPLFINIGDQIKIDTRTGEYVERVK